jgi:hypothetical protein
MDDVWPVSVASWYEAAIHGASVDGSVSWYSFKNGWVTVAHGLMNPDMELDDAGMVSALRFRGTLDRPNAASPQLFRKTELTIEYLLEDEPGTTMTTVLATAATWSEIRSVGGGTPFGSDGYVTPGPDALLSVRFSTTHHPAMVPYHPPR